MSASIHLSRRRRIVVAEQVVSAIDAHGHPEDENLDELVEDVPIRQPGPVAAQPVLVDHGRDQGGELVPEGFDDGCWNSRYEGS